MKRRSCSPSHYRTRRGCSPPRTRSSAPALSSTPRNRAMPSCRSKTKVSPLRTKLQQIENGTKIFTNTVKIATTALQTYNTVQQQYNLYRQMMNSPQMLYSRFLSPRSDLMLMQQVSNTYGNSMGWLNASNTGTGAAASYQQAVVPRTPNMVPGYGTASVAGQQQIAAQGATIDIGDSVMTTNLQVLGTIRANQTARQTDIANLETASQSQDPSQQTVMATLQRINQALLLQLRTQQDANQINANLALQQMIAQKQQQDAMKAGFLDAGRLQQHLPGSGRHLPITARRKP